MFEGVIGKYALPYLSIPFVLALWTITIATREFESLGVSQRGIYTLNDLYIIGGDPLVRLYQWWNDIAINVSVKSYFLSLGAIFFQFNVLSGIIIAIGLLIYSRIAFTLSLIGFYAAFLFYNIIGAEITEITYSYIGFNYILTSIAIGGFFIIPGRLSYLWVIILMPLVAILTISVSAILTIQQLPVYSLPFNIIVLLFLYILKLRKTKRDGLTEVIIQQNSPERNLYSFLNYKDRFNPEYNIPLKLPFYGEWTINQGHNGEYTHKEDWRHAWDFVIYDEENKTHKNSGDYREDYFCYDKSVLSSGDGTVEEVIDDIPDNKIGELNLTENWGNTIIIKHSDYIYSKLSHLKPSV